MSAPGKPGATSPDPPAGSVRRSRDDEQAAPGAGPGHRGRRRLRRCGRLLGVGPAGRPDRDRLRPRRRADPLRADRDLRRGVRRPAGRTGAHRRRRERTAAQRRPGLRGHEGPGAAAPRGAARHRRRRVLHHGAGVRHRDGPVLPGLRLQPGQHRQQRLRPVRHRRRRRRRPRGLGRRHGRGRDRRRRRHRLRLRPPRARGRAVDQPTRVLRLGGRRRQRQGRRLPRLELRDQQPGRRQRQLRHARRERLRRHREPGPTTAWAPPVSHRTCRSCRWSSAVVPRST
jgi:hypothetical protein